MTFLLFTRSGWLSSIGPQFISEYNSRFLPVAFPGSLMAHESLGCWFDPTGTKRAKSQYLNGLQAPYGEVAD